VSVTFVSGYPAAWWSKIHKLPPEIYRRVRSRCENQNQKQILTAPTVVFTAIAIAPWIVLMFAPVGFMASGMHWRWWSFAPQVLGQLVFLGSAIWYGSRLTARVRIEAILDESICPSCRYPIGDIPAAEDGCTVCPECGAAWRLPARGAGEARGV
jgi:hypothetical protein